MTSQPQAVRRALYTRQDLVRAAVAAAIATAVASAVLIGAVDLCARVFFS